MTGRDKAVSIAFDLERAMNALNCGKPNTALALVELAHADVGRLAEQLVSDCLEVGELVVDLRGRTALLAGERVPLAGRPFDLLAVLASEPDRAWPRRLLYQRVWGADLSESSRTLDAAAQRLRAALGRNWIQTVHGVGYRLTLGPPGTPARLPRAAAELVGSAP